jgi:lysozyme
MRLSDNGRRLIQQFEGLSLKAYPDANGYSIGYGHFGAQPGDVITRDEADRLFAGDVAKFELAVSLAAPVADQDQFDAMTSLAYNIGSAAFAKSTLVAKHNMGDYAGAADEFLRWNKSQGKVLPVLSRRRELERNAYLRGFEGAPYTPSVPFELRPAPAVARGSTDATEGAMLLAGLGMVFFCPMCFGRFHNVGVEIEGGG